MPTVREAAGAADHQRHQPDDQQPAQQPLPARVGRRPEQRAPAGPAERARLEGHAALLDLGDGAEHDRPDDRHDAAQPAHEASFRVQAARALRGDDRLGALGHRRHRLHRGVGDEREARRNAATLEIEHELVTVSWSGRRA